MSNKTSTGNKSLIDMSENIMVLLRDVVSEQRKHQQTYATLEQSIETLTDRIEMFHDNSKSIQRFAWMVFSFLIIPVGLWLWSSMELNKNMIHKLDGRVVRIESVHLGNFDE